MKRIEELEGQRSELLEAINALEVGGEKLEQERDVLLQENKLLRLKVQGLIDRIYGRRSERVDPNQKLFFPELFSDAPTEEEAEEESEGKPRRRKRKKAGRRPIPEDIERRRVVLPPAVEDSCCPGCSKTLVKIGEEVTEELDFEPGKFFVTEYVREKLACKGCEEGVYMPPLPPRPIEKGRPGPGLLAHVAVSKHGDHLPLYRQENIFARAGFEIPRSTLCEWTRLVAELLEPIVLEIKRSLLQAPLVQSDDTPIRVQDPRIRGKCRKGYVWCYTIPWGEVVYDFTLSRSRDGPLEFLKGYRGYLQSDAYGGYNEVIRREKLIHIGCMGHARRYFHEARFQSRKRVLPIISTIKDLYAIEAEAKEAGLSLEEKVNLRQERALPILADLKALIREAGRAALRKSPLGKAVTYAQNNWESLVRYVEVGEAEIDNISAEHTIRPLAVGRRNWLFVGSPGGGQRLEVLASLITSCKRLGVEPFSYLRDVIDRISTHPQSRIWELTPRGWKDSQEMGQ